MVRVGGWGRPKSEKRPSSRPFPSAIRYAGRTDRRTDRNAGSGGLDGPLTARRAAADAPAATRAAGPRARPFADLLRAEPSSIALGDMVLARKPKPTAPAARAALTLVALARNPVRHAARPKRRRATDANTDLKFLHVDELEQGRGE